jgi:hypothetical protein
MDPLHLAILMKSLKLLGKIIFFHLFVENLMKNDSGIGSKIILKFREPKCKYFTVIKNMRIGYCSWEPPEFLWRKF